MDAIRPDIHRVTPGFHLEDIDPAFSAGLDLEKRMAKKTLAAYRDRITELQERLYAESRQALLVVLQAMDTGGKDSTLRAVTEGVNPQGVQIRSFKAPSKEELAHDYLWRVHKVVPPKGHITFFNRSHYEDVLVVRVHGWAPEEVIEERYDQINDFEHLLSGTGTKVVKIMLYISKDYQLQRLRRRLERPDKHWKFNPGDLKERALWPSYMDAYQVALTRCSTEIAPWYVVPAERRWYRNLVVAKIVVEALEAMNPQYPKPTFDPEEFQPGSIT